MLKQEVNMAFLPCGHLHVVEKIGVVFPQFVVNEAIFADMQTAGKDQGSNVGW